MDDELLDGVSSLSCGTSFHAFCGRDVVVSGKIAMGRVAAERASTTGSQRRRSCEPSRCYVFGDHPLQCGDLVEFSIIVLGVDTTSTEGLAFGMTSCDPSEMHASCDGVEDFLPADPDALMDRQEYWVVTKNLLSGDWGCEEGDVLTFELNDNGEVTLNKNGELVQTLMHIDKTLPMWPFVNINGRVKQIALIDSTDNNRGVVSIEPSPAISIDDTMPSYYSAGVTISTTTNHNSTENSDNNNRYKSPSQRLIEAGSSQTHHTSSSHSETEGTGRQTATRPVKSLTREEGQPTVEVRTTQQPATMAPSSASHRVESVPPIVGNQKEKPSTGVMRTPFKMQSSFDGQHVTQSVVAAALSAFEKRHQLAQSNGAMSSNDGSCSSGQRLRISTNVANAETASFDRCSVDNEGRVGLLTRGTSLPESAFNQVTASASTSRSASTKRRAPVAPPAGVQCSVAHHHSDVRPRADAQLQQQQQQTKRADSHEAGATECCLCFERPRDTVIYRCGHVCLCYGCALDIREFHKPPLCPICRQPIFDIIKIFKA